MLDAIEFAQRIVPQPPTSQRVVIAGVLVRAVTLNREDANPAAGVFFVADPRLSGYRVAGSGRAHSRLWLERTP